STIHVQPLDKEKLEAKAQQSDLEGAGYRKVRSLAKLHAGEIELRFPKILRRVGGYNLDFFTEAAKSETVPFFSLVPLFVGSEGTLGLTLEAKLRLIELPRAKALLVVQFADLLDALTATPAILAHAPAAVEVLDRY